MKNGRPDNGKVAPGNGEVPGVQGSAADASPRDPGPSRWVRRRSDAVHARALEASDASFARSYPALFEWLTLAVLEGTARETATLLIFVEDGRFKGCLHDREGSAVLFRSGRTMVELLEALEGCLVDGSADWREKRGAGPRR